MQETREERVHEELEDLLQEVNDFRKEKEQVRAIVGKIGGVPSRTTKVLNGAFIVFLAVILTFSVFIDDARIHWTLVDIAIFAVSLKLIYLIHKQSQVNHLQTWILSSLEWRINEILKEMRELGRQTPKPGQ
ncbi:MAG TPA: hypothetical protein PLI51_09510 [bacterium]|nr:hypothetical protein [bacterium]HPQ66950.1 hypothetical protein [bacterium]